MGCLADLTAESTKLKTGVLAEKHSWKVNCKVPLLTDPQSTNKF
jgi:hypothetical protein